MIRAQALEHSLRVWGSEGVMGVWIKVPRDKVALVPVATEAGFDFHHAETGHVMMNFWLPDDTPTTLPACGATQLGVRALLVASCPPSPVDRATLWLGP